MGKLLMKSMRKQVVVLFCLLMPAFGLAQEGWNELIGLLDAKSQELALHQKEATGKLMQKIRKKPLVKNQSLTLIPIYGLFSKRPDETLHIEDFYGSNDSVVRSSATMEDIITRLDMDNVPICQVLVLDKDSTCLGCVCPKVILKGKSKPRPELLTCDDCPELVSLYSKHRPDAVYCLAGDEDCLLFYERGKLVPVYKKAGLDEHYQEIDVDSFIKMITSEKWFDYFMFYHSVREIVFG